MQSLSHPNAKLDCMPLGDLCCSVDSLYNAFRQSTVIVLFTLIIARGLSMVYFADVG